MFLLLFVAGSMVIPIMLDAKKNPGNHILKRAYKDIKEYKKVFFEKK